MLYRFALGIGLLLLGAFVGRETSRTAPVRRALRVQRQNMALLRPTAPPSRKISIH